MKSYKRKTVYDFVTKKKYKDGTEKIYIKTGCLRTPTEEDLQKERTLPKLLTAIQSAHRAHNLLLDLAMSNSWKFFITLTFGNEEAGGKRLDDTVVKGLFQEWRKFFKRKYPEMYYIMVPEYHKKGGLHFHGIIGGITAEQLKLADSGKVCCSFVSRKVASRDYYEKNKHNYKLTLTDGLTIFNAEVWKYGFSTVTEVKSPEAVRNYIVKYIGKGQIDPRFFNQKRFWASKHLERPYIEKLKHIAGSVELTEREYVISESYLKSIKYDPLEWVVEYSSEDKHYMILRKRKENENIEKDKSGQYVIKL